MKSIAIIPSGGKGLRFGGSLPKQYVKIHGRELISYTLQIFEDCDLIDDIIIAAQPEYFDLLNEVISKYSFQKVKKIVTGGETRQDSVYNALKTVSPCPDLFIAVHDAARPFLNSSILCTGLDFAKEFGSAVTAIKAKDTLLKGDEFVVDYLERDSIFYVQTPQIFRYEILKEAFEKALLDKFQGTDESMLVKRLGYKIKIVEGSSLNMKITTKDDLKIADSILKDY